MSRISTPSSALLSLSLALPAALALAGCDDSSDPEASSIVHEGPVIPTVFFSADEGADITPETPADAPVYKRTPDGDVRVLSPEGEPLSWGEFATAAGTTVVTCEGDGTFVTIEADGLQPGGVYTGWLAFFDAPGFRAAGLETVAAISALGPSDGSEATLIADENGEATADIFVPAGAAGIPMGRDFDIPACLLDVLEVHVVLAYHWDGNTCGPSPCEPHTYGEQVGWIVEAGEVFAP